MWWWQSVALAGAFSLGASVPADHLTDWADAGRAWAAARAATGTTFRTSRRLQDSALIGPSSRPAVSLSRGPFLALRTWCRSLREASARGACHGRSCIYI